MNEVVLLLQNTFLVLLVINIFGASTVMFIPRVNTERIGQNLSLPLTVKICGKDLIALDGGVQQNLKLSALGPFISLLAKI